MKKIAALFLLTLSTFSAFACPVCEKNQPKLLKGIAHGAGPESNFDYVIVWGLVAITVLTLVFALKYLINPGEKEENHIKRTFLTFE
ncbi:MAG: hypothetical protein NWQ46_10105 [Spirosomaceae bacterium]|nr:hypothetical protein [Spirosomataceae bacterium]MDP5140602.1 hypothetical protein [Spirosomataceae bacterium]